MKKQNRKQKPIADSSPGSVANAPVSGSLSDYVKGLFEKNSKVFIVPVKMNKKKANYALLLLDKMAQELDILLDSPDDEVYGEYMDCINWFRNQILKRYSKAETIL